MAQLCDRFRLQVGGVNLRRRGNSLQTLQPLCCLQIDAIVWHLQMTPCELMGTGSLRPCSPSVVFKLTPLCGFFKWSHVNLWGRGHALQTLQPLCCLQIDANGDGAPLLYTNWPHYVIQFKWPSVNFRWRSHSSELTVPALSQNRWLSTLTGSTRPSRFYGSFRSYSVIKVRIQGLLGTSVQRRSPSTLHLFAKCDFIYIMGFDVQSMQLQVKCYMTATILLMVMNDTIFILLKCAISINV
jgi:hypothetical protein